MKIWFKIGIATFVGFVGGFGAGFLFHKKLTNVEFEEVSEEEMNEITGHLNDKNEPSEKKTLTDEDLSTDPDKLRMQLQGKTSYIEADRAAKEKYAQIWGTVKDYSDKDNADGLPIENGESLFNADEGIDQGFIQEVMEEDPPQVGGEKASNIYPIELVDFYEENGYDKITVDWYQPDNTFLDEKEDIIADISTYIGDINLKELFETTYEREDPDVRFVRNEGYSTDYEIIRHHRSWTETTGMGGSE